MKLTIFTLFALCGLAIVVADPHKVVKEWKEKIKNHHFMCKCMGEKTMMNFYKMAEKSCEECQQLAPAMDFDLFTEADNEEYNVVGDEMENPFIMTQAGSQLLPNFNTAPFRGANPLESYLQMWAPQYGAQNVPYYQYGRGKRAIDPPTQEEMKQFAGHIAEFKEEKMDKMANLTCVLRKMGALDANLNINLKHFTQDMWSKFAVGEQPDAEFKKHMVQGFENCHEMATSLPEDLLAKKGPFYAKFGRQMMFFKCKKMMFDANCVMKELSAWTEMMYGTPSEAKRAKMGLPKDLYKANLMAWTVKKNVKTPTQKFVHEFLFGGQ